MAAAYNMADSEKPTATEVPSIPRATPIPAELVEVLKGAPQPLKAQILQIVQTNATMYNGPIPPPEMLAAYKGVDERLPRDIVDAWKGETKHRRWVEKVSVVGPLLTRTLGQVFAFLLVLAMAYTSYEVAVAGHPALAGAIMTTTLLGILGAFLHGKLPSKSAEEPPAGKKQQKRKPR